MFFGSEREEIAGVAKIERKKNISSRSTTQKTAFDFYAGVSSRPCDSSAKIFSNISTVLLLDDATLAK